ncbi:hypothetical protein ACTA71_006106 [Dictyostelium dimigraforme]
MSNQIKINVVGKSNAGKSTLCNCFINGLGLNCPNITVVTDMLHKDIIVEEKKYNITLYDIPGQSERMDLTHSFLRVDGSILVYDVADLESFNKIRSWHGKVEPIIGKGNIYIFENKCDLIEKRIKEGEGKQLANNLECEFFQTSAKSPETIETALNCIIEKIIRKKAKENELPEKVNFQDLKQNKCDC